MKKKDFISLHYFSAQELVKLIDLSAAVKNNFGKYCQALKGKCVGLLFQKPSLRTKTAFYVGALQLGAEAVYYAPSEVSLGEREKISDVARTLSTYLDAVVLRTFSHEIVLEFAEFSSIPVINGLSNSFHPSQVLGDLLTIRECKGDMKKVNVVYVGDGNNMCHSLMHALALLGGNLRIATPPRYQPNKDVLEESLSFAAVSGGRIEIVSSPEEAVRDADVLYTDVWTSMGNEKERDKRKKIFKKFQINDDLLNLARHDCIVMHCLPAHRGEEVTDSVIDGDHSVVFPQAANRLYSAKAILLYLLAGEEL